MRTNRIITTITSNLLILTLMMGAMNFPILAYTPTEGASTDLLKGQPLDYECVLYKNCIWEMDNIFVVSAKIGDGDRKKLDTLLNALVKVLGAASAEVKAVTTAIDKLGPAGDVVDVVVIYKCNNGTGVIRKRIDLDGLTESIHWAAKTNLLTGVGKKDNDTARDRIIEQHRPKVPCCNVAPATPSAVGPKARPEYRDALPGGLLIEEFPTQFGKVAVNLPDDIEAGDTISGTVVAEPSGTTAEERETNTGELNGYVVEVQTEKTGTGKWGKWIVPAAATAVTLVLLDKRGKEVSRKDVPVGAAEPPMTSGPPRADDFELPTQGQAGRNIAAHGPFDGDLSETSVTIGGKPVPVLAESPRKAVFTTPAGIVGPSQIELRKGNVTARGNYRSIAMNLNAGKLSLVRGDRTKLDVTVRGLAGIEHPANVELVNRSAETVSLSGGERQKFTIPTEAIAADGSYKKSFDVTGVKAGNFQITANLLADDDGLAPPTNKKAQKEFIDAWHKARAAKKAADEAKKKAQQARKDANDAKEAADKAKKDARSAKDHQAPDKDDAQKKADKEKADADAKEKDAKAAEADAASKQADADKAKSDLDKASDNVRPSDKKGALEGESDRLDKEAKSDKDEADRTKKAIEEDGDPDGNKKDHQDKMEQQAQDKAEQSQDLKKEADAIKP